MAKITAFDIKHGVPQDKIIQKVMDVVWQAKYEQVFLLAGNYPLLLDKQGKYLPLVPEDHTSLAHTVWPQTITDQVTYDLCNNLGETYNFDTRLPYPSLQLGTELYKLFTEKNIDTNFILACDDKKVNQQISRENIETDGWTVRSEYYAKGYRALPKSFLTRWEYAFWSAKAFKKVLQAFPTRLQQQGKKVKHPYIISESYLVKQFDIGVRKEKVAFTDFKQEYTGKEVSSCIFELFSLFDIIKSLSWDRKTCLVWNFADLCSGSFLWASQAHITENFHTMAVTPTITGDDIYMISHNTENWQKII